MREAAEIVVRVLVVVLLLLCVATTLADHDFCNKEDSGVHDCQTRPNIVFILADDLGMY